MLASHKQWVQMQHQRGLDLTTMNPVCEFIDAEQTRWNTEAKGVYPRHQHVEFCAQTHGNQIDQWHLATVTVEDDQFAYTGACDATADVEPALHQHLRINAQRAMKIRVLKAVANVHGRQHEHGQIISNQLQTTTHDAVVDKSIGAQWQVRAVLFDRGDRQHRHGARNPYRTQILTAQLMPIA